MLLSTYQPCDVLYSKEHATNSALPDNLLSQRCGEFVDAQKLLPSSRAASAGRRRSSSAAGTFLGVIQGGKILESDLPYILPRFVQHLEHHVMAVATNVIGDDAGDVDPPSLGTPPGALTA